MQDISVRTGAKNRSRVSLVLTAASALLWAASVLQTEVNIGYFGLIHSFTLTYFASLACLGAASIILWFSPANHGKLLCLQLVLLIIILWLTPVLIGSNSVFVDIYYRDFVFHQEIVERGHIEPLRLWYHNWPGLWLFEAAAAEICGLENPDPIAVYGSFVMQFLVLLPVYVFFRYTIENVNYRWAAAWIFYLGNWTAQVYAEPQGVGFLLFMMVLCLLVKGQETAPGRTKNILIMSSMVITHLLSSIAAFLCMVMMWLTKRQKGITVSLVMVAAIIIAVWTIYGATVQFMWNLPHFLERAFQLDFLFQKNLLEPAAAASASHAAVNLLRIIFSAIFAFIGAGGFLLSFKFKNRADLSIALVLVSLAFMSVSTLYEQENFIRVYLFALVPVGYYAMKLLRNRFTSAILILLLAIALPLHLVAHYGNSAYNHVPQGEIAYWHFIRDEIPEGNFSGGFSPRTMEWRGYNTFSLDKLVWENGLLTSSRFNPGRPHYINAGELEEATHAFFGNMPDFIPEIREQLDGNSNYYLVYSNQDLVLYMTEGRD